MFTRHVMQSCDSNCHNVQARPLPDEVCSSEVLSSRVDLHKQKFPAAGAADDPVLAGLEQASHCASAFHSYWSCKLTQIECIITLQ